MPVIRELRIGNIEGEIGGDTYHKFIVSKDGESLVYHSLEYYPELIHKGVATQYNIPLENVIAGGSARNADPKILTLEGLSAELGKMHQDIMELFAPKLLDAYREIQPQIETVQNKIYDNVPVEQWLYEKRLQLDCPERQIFF
ncbi:MAG: hypothetical protein GY861_09245 [bacterium]|nr:hypothetical protein [bacterium]